MNASGTGAYSATSSITAENLWITAAPLPNRQYFHISVAANGKIYVFGGRDSDETFSSIWEYDPLSNFWAGKATTFDLNATELSYSRKAVEYEGKIYFAGGYDDPDFLSDFYVYDPASDTLTKKADLPVAASCIGLGAADGKIYALGGQLVDGWSNAVYCYDIENDEWERFGDLPESMTFFNAFTKGGKIYLLEDYHFAGACPIYVYDTATGEFTLETHLPLDIHGTSFENIGDNVYVFGGNDGTNSFESAYAYNLTGKT